MKTGAKIILKSLADLPASAYNRIVAAPQYTADVTMQLMAPPARATRRQLREARRRSIAFMQNIYQRAQAPFNIIVPWSRGGLNK